MGWFKKVMVSLHCRRCGKDFGLDGFHSWGKRGRNDPEEEGDYCFETTHIPQEIMILMRTLSCRDWILVTIDRAVCIAEVKRFLYPPLPKVR